MALYQKEKGFENMSSTFGTAIKLSVFGQSHGESLGMVLDGLPAGETVDLDVLQAFMERRAPGRNAWSTKRKEPDVPVCRSGLFEGKTCGAPLMMEILNQNQRSGDYANLNLIPRPSHADYPASVKYGGFADYRGGGHFSGRITAAFCMAGGVCLQILKRRGIEIGAHILQIGNVKDRSFDPVSLQKEELLSPGQKPFPVLLDEKGIAMQNVIESARKDGDSIGGVVETAVLGLPVGLGEPLFGGIENVIASAVFGIGGVRGISFGEGFAAAEMRGSEHNDAYEIQDGKVKGKTNHAGGVLGGMATGMPLIFQTAFKPTPSISLEQESVSLPKMSEEKLVISGRHDPCIVPRALPVTEAMAAIAITDLMCQAGLL